MSMDPGESGPLLLAGLSGGGGWLAPVVACELGGSAEIVACAATPGKTEQ